MIPFQVGDKVVFIGRGNFTGYRKLYPNINVPQYGEIYTVRWIGYTVRWIGPEPTGKSDDIGVLLNEIVNPKELFEMVSGSDQYTEPRFCAYEFRPVINKETKTDISVFLKILQPTTKQLELT